MRTLIIIAVIFSLCSCATQKKCNRKFPAETIIKDSVSVVIRDSISTDTIFLPGESILIHDTIPCPDVEYHREVRSNNTIATVHISKGVITVECKTDSLQHIIEVKNKIIDKYRFHSSEKTKIQKVFHNRWYDIALRWYGVITLIMLVLYLLKKRYLG